MINAQNCVHCKTCDIKDPEPEHQLGHARGRRRTELRRTCERRPRPGSARRGVGQLRRMTAVRVGRLGHTRHQLSPCRGWLASRPLCAPICGRRRRAPARSSGAEPVPFLSKSLFARACRRCWRWRPAPSPRRPTPPAPRPARERRLARLQPADSLEGNFLSAYIAGARARHRGGRDLLPRGAQGRSAQPGAAGARLRRLPRRRLHAGGVPPRRAARGARRRERPRPVSRSACSSSRRSNTQRPHPSSPRAARGRAADLTATLLTAWA